MTHLADDPGRAQPIAAGIVTAVVGFSSSFAVVLAGLTAVGATPEQAASGLLVLCLASGLGILWLSRRHRIPLTLAWSTPGAALLAASGGVDGGWAAAVGAFCVVGVLVLATAAWPRLGALVAAIPTSLAQAMLAGVLLPLCLAPVTALADRPAVIAPVVLTWLVVLRLAPRWAVPAALAVTMIEIVVLVALDDESLAAASLLPALSWTAPTFGWQALVGLALPLYVVTMASQNVPGVAVMAGFGYAVPWRASMAVTGAGTLLGAPFGGHAVNLAAISAALSASPQASPDPRRRWVAAQADGWAFLVLAVTSAAFATLVAAAPPGLVEAAAGLALLATLGGSLAAATAESDGREAAVVTFVVAASGVSVVGIGAAFWALVAGLLVRTVLRRPRPVGTPSDADGR